MLHPMILDRLRRHRQFLTFAVIGTIGFLVDSGVLQFEILVLGVSSTIARLPSFLVAATVTWALNRTFTFKPAPGGSLLAEWARFLSVNAVGGLINVATYYLLLYTVPLVARNPILGIAAGSIAGLGSNYLGSKRIVFRNRTGEALRP